MAIILGNIYDLLHNNGMFILGDFNGYTQHTIS